MLVGALALWSLRRTRVAVRNRIKRSALRVIHRFELRLERYRLVDRRVIRDELMLDGQLHDAMREHCAAHGLGEQEVRLRVEKYIEEILPFFNVLSYYKLGYNVARVVVNLLYKVSTEYQDEEALNAIPRDDVVVYLMNHRSNADYVVVAYLLVHGISISYAVGEWARVWPLEYVFKSFGSYFVRRRYREPLYHKVLERYIQLITRNGVTQGIFLEGGLSRDGRLRPPKVGLLDYVVRTLLDSEFGERNIWLIPTALNYDRVLEDRTLIQELCDEEYRPSRAKQLATVSRFVTHNLLRLVSGNLKRYGRVAVNFGTPLSMRDWVAQHPGILEQPKERRLSHIQLLADEVLARIAAIVPVTPVPLTAACLLSFNETLIRRDDLLERLDEFRDHLNSHDAKLVHAAGDVTVIFDRAWKTLKMRRLAVKEGDSYIILPHQRPLLEYYANSVRHLLPASEMKPQMHPAREADTSLPGLRKWERTANDL